MDAHYYSLPILSTYIGHQSVQATDQYVRLTAAMYPDLIQQVSNAQTLFFLLLMQMKPL